jgi:hypothetical protein
VKRAGPARAAALAALCALAAGVVAGAEPAGPGICGTHEVAPGETLAGIAREVYGRADAARLIAEANREALPDPDLLRVGQVLRLPCDPQALDPAPPAEAPSATAPAAPEVPAAEPPPDDAPPALAAPPAAADGAILVAAPAGAAEAALARLRSALGDRELRLREAPDPAGALHPDGDALLAAPVRDPGCARFETLPPAQAALCVRHDWSAPLRALETAWLVRADSPLRDAYGPGALRGLHVCRPAAMPVGDMVAAGLADEAARRLAPASAADCLRAVRAGEADAAGLLAETARAAQAAPDAGAEGLAEAPALSGRLTEHAVSRRDSARGRAALADLNRGLARSRP